MRIYVQVAGKVSCNKGPTKNCLRHPRLIRNAQLLSIIALKIQATTSCFIDSCMNWLSVKGYCCLIRSVLEICGSERVWLLCLRFEMLVVGDSIIFLRSYYFK